MKSDYLKEIRSDAESGDEESAELLGSISLHVDSVAFHLENDSPDHRVHYEVGLFKRFVEKLFE